MGRMNRHVANAKPRFPLSLDLRFHLGRFSSLIPNSPIGCHCGRANAHSVSAAECSNASGSGSNPNSVQASMDFEERFAPLLVATPVDKERAKSSYCPCTASGLDDNRGEAAMLRAYAHQIALSASELMLRIDDAASVDFDAALLDEPTPFARRLDQLGLG